MDKATIISKVLTEDPLMCRYICMVADNKSICCISCKRFINDECSYSAHIGCKYLTYKCYIQDLGICNNLCYFWRTLMTKLYDELSNKWYTINRNFLGSLKLSVIKEVPQEPQPGDVLLMASGGCMIVKEEPSGHFVA